MQGEAPVSYTHLDVYKRQINLSASVIVKWEEVLQQKSINYQNEILKELRKERILHVDETCLLYTSFVIGYWYVVQLENFQGMRGNDTGMYLMYISADH